MIAQIESDPAHNITKEHLYNYLETNRQRVHQIIKDYEGELQMMEIIKVLVNDYRDKKDRLAGSRSMFYNLGVKARFSIGVTKFEGLLSKYGLTQNPMRIRIVTTKSSYQSWNYKNLVKGLSVSNINRVIVGDITYISYNGKEYYLFCLLDVFSQRIVGFCISDRMRSIEAQMALKMAISLRGKDTLINCFHHTDGGGQYFAKIYLQITSKYFKGISVAKTCLENGYAEQKNGYIKHHLLPTTDAYNLASLKGAIKNCIAFYNNERKQKELFWLSPLVFEKEIEKGNIEKTIVLK